MSIYTLKTDKKILLSELLVKNGLSIDKPCNGKGLCGKCKIKAEGYLSPISSAEKMFLTTDEILSGIRLACKTYVFNECKIEIYETEEKNCDKILDEMDTCCAAVDIGTTVIEACFFSLPNYKFIKKVSAKNPQAEFGADVMSRLSCSMDKEKRELMKYTVRKTINELAKNLNVSKWVISGNTVMLHLFTGMDPSSMCTYPFKPESLFGFWDENRYYPKCISSFIGADITMAILSSKMLSEPSPSLLIDIGTNGEMVLFDGQNLYCTSTSAGPALEGTSISMGMLATDGAINKIDKDGNYETIGHCSPKGICASGLIDCLSYMLQNDIVTKDGFLEKPYQIQKSNVFLSPQDIRNLQLAKGAIRAGIEVLLEKTGLTHEDLKTVYISGTLGNNMCVCSAIEIGLLPNLNNEKFKLIGNGSLNGACMVLKNEYNQDNVDAIIKNSKVFDLALTDSFLENYMKYISF